MKAHRPWIMAAGGLTVLGAVLAAWSFGPQHRFTPFSTPEITSDGARIELLVPAGWREERARPMGPVPSGVPNRIVIMPSEQASPLMEWLGTFIRMPKERSALIWIHFRRRHDAGERITHTFTSDLQGAKTYIADAVLPVAHGLEASLQYLRTDAAAFQATARPFLNSIRVTR